MAEKPTSRGLFLCEQTIIEARTNNYSLINMFDQKVAASFPATFSPFSVFSALVFGFGRVRVDLQMFRFPEAVPLYQESHAILFDSPVHVIRFHSEIEVAFPVPGWYEFKLLADGEELAQTMLHVITEGEA